MISFYLRALVGVGVMLPGVAFADRMLCPEEESISGTSSVELSVFAQRGQQFKVSLNSGLGHDVREQTYTTPFRVRILSGTTTLAINGENLQRCWRFILPPDRASLVRIYNRRDYLLWPGLALFLLGLGASGGSAGLIGIGGKTLQAASTPADYAKVDQQLYSGIGLLVGGVLALGTGALMMTFGLRPGIWQGPVPPGMELPPLTIPSAP